MGSIAASNCPSMSGEPPNPVCSRRKSRLIFQEPANEVTPFLRDLCCFSAVRVLLPIWVHIQKKRKRTKDCRSSTIKSWSTTTIITKLPPFTAKSGCTWSRESTRNRSIDIGLINALRLLLSGLAALTLPSSALGPPASQLVLAIGCPLREAKGRPMIPAALKETAQGRSAGHHGLMSRRR